MNRDTLSRLVRKRLDGRQLVFFGTRGDDAEGVGDLPELSAVFSVVAAHRRRTSIQSLALEELTGRRVDLDAHDIDDEPRSAEVVELRRTILRVLSRESVVFTYRPSTFLSAICFARRDRCAYAGLFKEHQSAFEHKPWVESSVRDLGIPCLPWTYIADEDQLETLRYLSDGPVVLRRSRSSGGTGFIRVESRAELEATWPRQDEIFVSVCRYIENAIPTNVGGVVWHDGVTLHPPSVQLIGVPECTDRPFGYCGNDFGAMKDLDVSVIDQMQEVTWRIGIWLSSYGYRGAFGVDFLVDGGRALFTEVNPRFQGVTHLSCQLSAEAGESCIMLEHIAALLGLDSPVSRPLRDQVLEGPDLAHFVLHWKGPSPGIVERERLDDALLEWPEVKRTDVTCPPDVMVDPGATMARVTVHNRITCSGFELLDPWASRARAVVMKSCEGAA